MEAEGYTRSEGWPKAQIDEHLVKMEVTQRLPEIEVTKEIFYSVYDEPFMFQQEIVEVAIFDTTTESVDAIKGVLLGAGWTDYSKPEENLFQVYNAEQTIAVLGGVYAGDADFPAMTLLYVVGFDQRDPLAKYQKVQAWPEARINAYLATFGITDVVVPGLPFTGDGFIHLIEDDPNFDPYLSLVIPGENRVEEYKGILTAGGFPWQADEVYNEYFYAENAAGNVLVEFFFAEEEGKYPAGMYIYVSQQVTFTAGQNIEMIKFVTHETHADSVESLVNSLPDGVIHAVNGNIVTVKLATPALTFSLEVATQFRLMSVDLFFI